MDQQTNGLEFCQRMIISYLFVGPVVCIVHYSASLPTVHIRQAYIEQKKRIRSIIQRIPRAMRQTTVASFIPRSELCVDRNGGHLISFCNWCSMFIVYQFCNFVQPKYSPLSQVLVLLLNNLVRSSFAVGSVSMLIACLQEGRQTRGSPF